MQVPVRPSVVVASVELILRTFSMSAVPLEESIGLPEVNRLERDVLGPKHGFKLSAGGYWTEHQLCSQQQGCSSGFGVKDVQVGMATLQIDHHRHDLPRVRQTNIVGKGHHVVKRQGSSIQIQTLERSRQTPPGPCHHGSTRPEIEVSRRETGSAPGDRESLADQERNKDSIVEEEGPRRQGRGRRWPQDLPHRRRPQVVVEPRPWPFPRHPAGSVRHPPSQRTRRCHLPKCPNGAATQQEGSSVHDQKPLPS